MIIKKKLIFYIIVLLVFPLVYANNYGSGTYGSGKYSAENISSPTPILPDSSTGGSSSSCTYDWQCTNWFPSLCSESEIQERVCANKGTCRGTVGLPNQTQTCKYLGSAEPLFDIFLTLSDESKEACSGNKIKANVKLENYGKIELLDAFMTYWILDENNTLIAELKDTQAVEKGTNFNVELKIPESTVKGTYRLYAEITYSGNKTAVTGESFEVLSQEDCKPYLQFDFNWIYLVYIAIGIFIILIILVLIKLFKKIFKTIKEKIVKTRKRGKYALNSLMGLIKKRVYTEDGNYIGKVKEIILTTNRIYSLKINFDKQLKIKKKLKEGGLIIKYEKVKRVGQIVIVDKEVLNSF